MKVSSSAFHLLWAFPLMLSGCGEVAAPVPEEARPVLAIAVTRSQDALSSTYSGEIRARHETRLAFKVTGKVTQRLVEVGSRVEAGQVLMRLDSRDATLSEQSAAAQTESAQIKLAQSNIDLQRYLKLHDEGFISKAALDQYRLAQDTAASQLRSALAQQRLSVNQRDYNVLTAEHTGVVTAIEAEAGQVVAVGQAVLTMAVDGEREVGVSVPEARIDELRAAQRIAVATWVNPNKVYSAVLRELAPDADKATRTYAARVTIEEPDDALRLGMTATVHIENVPQSASIQVPLAAVHHRAGAAQVWVVTPESSTVAARPVTLGGTDRNHVRIANGLREGELVVSAGAHLLHPNQKVKVLSSSQPGGRAS